MFCQIQLSKGETPLALAVRLVGGQKGAAEACGITIAAVSQMVKRGSLPRTEYTGETNYASALASASEDQFDAEWLLDAANPAKVKRVQEDLVSAQD